MRPTPFSNAGGRTHRWLVFVAATFAGLALVATGSAQTPASKPDSDASSKTYASTPSHPTATRRHTPTPTSPHTDTPALQGYRLALPGYQFQFPRDHAAHPEFQTEWWYYTGHLQRGKRKFGYELTFFQVGIDPQRKQSRSAWALHTLYFAHLTLTDEQDRKFRYTESISRPALGMAGAATDRYHVWVHDWSAQLLGDERTHRLVAAAPEFSFRLDLHPAKPPVVHGHDGVSQKSAGLGRASHYYSMTRLETSGTLKVEDETFQVTGLSWMDHEFGSNQLTPLQQGWDWFSIQLDDRRELMVYMLRLKNGRIEPLSSGTLVNADGTHRHLALESFQVSSGSSWKSRRSGAVYPSRWKIRVPSENLELTLTPTLDDQELLTGGAAGVTYWEGSVRVEGSDRRGPVSGKGYVELTGYAGAVPGI